MSPCVWRHHLVFFLGILLLEVFIYWKFVQCSVQIIHDLESSCPKYSELSIDKQEILEKLSKEVNEYDHKLGLILHRSQLEAWLSLTGIMEELPDREEQLIKPYDDADIFFRKYLRWAVERFHQYCLGIFQKEVDPIYQCHMDKHCQYLVDVGEEFRRYAYVDSNLDGIRRMNSSDYSTELQSSEKTHIIQEWIQELGEKVRNIYIMHRGKKLVCEESLEQVMMKIEDPQELKSIWIRCHQTLSTKFIPQLFQKIRSKLGGSDFKLLWAHWNQDLGVELPQWILSKAVVLWNQVKPFYRLLFEFIRHRLRQHFGPNDPDYLNSSTIPIYWLRSLTGTRLYTIIDLMRPYEDLPKEHDYNDTTFQGKSIDFIQDVAKFYVRVGFEPLPDSFWQKSRIVTNSNCHPVALDMFTGKDVRINMCLTEDSQYDSRKLCHELGHIYYYLGARNRRNLYKLDHNSAAHESIGEVMRLLWNGCRLSEKQQVAKRDRRLSYQYRINALMEEALSSFVMIPYGMSLERWRYRAFTQMKNASLKELNQDYWSIRKRIQGFRSAMNILDGDLHQNEQAEQKVQQQLDPLLKFHVANFVPYLRYVFGTILMHQFHEKICSGKNQYRGGSDFLVECCPRDRSDLYLFRKFLTINLNGQGQRNQRKSDLEIFQKLFGSDRLSYRMDSLLRYYQPLIEWLQEWKGARE